MSKRQRCPKAKAYEAILRLGEDIQLSDTMEIANRVKGMNYNATRLKQWASEVWGQHLADPPFVQTFFRGRFSLHFTRVEHTNWVLSEDVLRRLGNVLGSYLDHDKSYLMTGMMAYARVLVHLDTSDGLQEYITIQWRNFTRR